MSPVDTDQNENPAPADIKISAHGGRRTLEAFYLDLRELAHQNGLEVEYRLTLRKPSGPPA